MNITNECCSKISNSKYIRDVIKGTSLDDWHLLKVLTKLTKYVRPEKTLQEHNLGIQQIKAQFIQ